MREWKNKEPFPLRRKKLYYFGIFGSFALAGFHYLVYGFLNIENIIGIGMSVFLIYCIKFGGAYKIARWYAERKVRKSDNDWDPHWIK